MAKKTYSLAQDEVDYLKPQMLASKEAERAIKIATTNQKNSDLMVRDYVELKIFKRLGLKFEDVKQFSLDSEKNTLVVEHGEPLKVTVGGKDDALKH